MRHKLLAATLVVVAFAGFTGTAGATLPASLQRIWDATETGAQSVDCVSQRTLKILDGDLESKNEIYGYTNVATRRVLLDRKRVCEPLIAYQRTGRLMIVAEHALVTFGHEAAHLRSVTSERKAECLGIRFAYHWLGRNGAFDIYEEQSIKKHLLDDSGRPYAYRVGSRCSL